MRKRYRFVLVDQHRLNVDALSQRISAEPDLRVAGVSDDARSAMSLIATERPDIVVLNVDLPECGAFLVAEDVVRRLPDTRIVFLASFLSDIFLDEALRLKARGFLLTSEDTDMIINRLHQICAGERAFSPDVAQRLERNAETGEYQVRVSGYLNTLTSRQLEVLRHLVRGDSVKEVAQRMMLSERAIESHKYRIMRKLGLHDRVALARYAIREGLTAP